MKRVIQRKAEHFICEESSNLGGSPSKQKRASQDIGNKTRTSAAMLGLALSMGASGSILSHGKQAIAAEAKGTIDVSSVEGLLDRGVTSDSAIQVEEAKSGLSHVIREGETLWTISTRYGVSSDSLKKVNGLDSDVVLRVGQTVAIPSAKRNLASGDTVVPVKPVPSQELIPESESLVAQAEPETENLAQLQLADLPSDAELADNDLNASHVSHSEAVKVEKDSDVGVSKLTPDGATDKLSASADLGSPSMVDEGDFQIDELAEVGEPILVAEHVAFSEVQPSESSSILDSSVALPTTHQIRVGETLADIARRYSISTQELADVNRIRNPNRIFAGRVLSLPDGATVSVAPVVSDVQVPSQDVSVGSLDADVESERVASLPSISEVEGSDDLESVVAPALTDVAPQVDSSFYINRLLSEIEELSQGYLVPDDVLEDAPSEEVSQPEASDVDVVAYAPAPLDDSRSLESPSGVEILPFQPEVDESQAAVKPLVPGRSASQEELFEDSAELVASAPLGAENYVPLNQPVTGRMVSPDLPPLSGPENYLPSGSDSFDGFIYPAQGTLTSGFGWRWGRMHRGIDVAAPIGTPIVAAAPGVIEYSGWNSGGYGNMVEVRHPDGSMTRYAHNSRNLVRVGQQVAQGEQIAEMGSTGYSTGPHVHFEIHLPDQGTVNPIAYLNP